jgi:hypothetical protein
MPPCRGGVEYLHRDPASRRRWRKGKSQIWDNKIWSRVPRDSDHRTTTLARASSIYKRQTRPLVREGTQQKEKYRNRQRVMKIWPWAPDGARHQDLLIDWPSVAMWLQLRLRYRLDILSCVRVRGLEYLHRSPASCRRRQKGNQVPGGITGPPCS